MLVLGNAHKKRNLQNMSKFLGEISKYFKGSQNMVKNPEKFCHILHKVKSIIGHLEIFFSNSKPSFRKSWNSEKKISRIHQCWCCGKRIKKRNLQHMSKFLREISTYVKGSQNMVKKGEILPYSAQSELHHWAPGDFLFQVQNLPSGSLGIRRRKFPG